jgi:RHS repeat-associated protein
MSASFNNSGLNTTFGRSYHYDAVGRIDFAGEMYTGAGRVFTYDQHGQLAEVDTKSGCSAGAFDPNSGYPASCASTTGSVAFSYDSVGNRTDLSATYFAGNRLANFNGGFFTYDADGNVHQKYMPAPGPNQFFYWNPENRLDSLSYDGYYTVRYEYNALGQPVKKYRNGSLDRVWLWDGDRWLAEFDASNTRVSEYQYAGLDQPYGSVVGSYAPSAIRYHEQDELGNVIGTHDGATVTQTISYDPWGTPTYSGYMDSRVMWKGLMWEGDVVGLYYMRGRWYDPQAGRFIQEDPLHSGVNDYTFAGNDPVNGSDPSGMTAQISFDNNNCQYSYTIGSPDLYFELGGCDFGGGGALTDFNPFAMDKPWGHPDQPGQPNVPPGAQTPTGTSTTGTSRKTPFRTFVSNVKHNRECDVALGSLAVSTFETATFLWGGYAITRAGKGLSAIGDYVFEEIAYKPTPANPGYGQGVGVAKWGYGIGEAMYVTHAGGESVSATPMWKIVAANIPVANVIVTGTDVYKSCTR